MVRVVMWEVVLGLPPIPYLPRSAAIVVGSSLARPQASRLRSARGSITSRSSSRWYRLRSRRTSRRRNSA